MWRLYIPIKNTTHLRDFTGVAGEPTQITNQQPANEYDSKLRCNPKLSAHNASLPQTANQPNTFDLLQT